MSQPTLVCVNEISKPEIWQLFVLLGLGVTWSAGIFGIVDGVKKFTGKPKTNLLHVGLTFGPLLLSMLACLWVFPWSLQVVGLGTLCPVLGLYLFSGFIGGVGWGASWAAHKLAGDAIRRGHATIWDAVSQKSKSSS